jgi:DNA-binding transcriptional regulator YdaS (Cro superfamily)
MDLKDYIKNQRGNATNLAEELDISISYLSQLASGSSPISTERCIEIEQATRGEVTCEELRPDVDWAYLSRRSPKSTEAA